jgi:hypothetical protein
MARRRPAGKNCGGASAQLAIKTPVLGNIGGEFLCDLQLSASTSPRPWRFKILLFSCG